MDLNTRSTVASRRSTTSLKHLSLAPLRTTVLDSDEPLESSQQQRSSYIQGKSAPSTPGILSRSASPNRHRSVGLTSKSYVHLAFADTTLPKSKSTTVLAQSQQKHRLDKRQRHAHAVRAADQGEWLFRAGAAISNETRESKGQSWLVSRASSTSLVVDGAAIDDDDDGRDDDFTARSGVASPVAMRSSSRNASRLTSALPSRRASGTYSRSDLVFYSPVAGRTPSARFSGDDYFNRVVLDDEGMAGPDFVESEDDEDGELDQSRADEAEIARLARERTFGLGGFVDRLLGWTLFEVREEGDGTDDEEDARPRPTRTRDGNASRAAARAGLANAHSGASVVGMAKEHEEEGEGGWKDVAWLLSVASKVIL